MNTIQRYVQIFEAEGLELQCQQGLDADGYPYYSFKCGDKVETIRTYYMRSTLEVDSAVSMLLGEWLSLLKPKPVKEPEPTTAYKEMTEATKFFYDHISSLVKIVKEEGGSERLKEAVKEYLEAYREQYQW